MRRLGGLNFPSSHFPLPTLRQESDPVLYCICMRYFLTSPFPLILRRLNKACPPASGGAAAAPRRAHQEFIPCPISLTSLPMPADFFPRAFSQAINSMCYVRFVKYGKQIGRSPRHEIHVCQRNGARRPCGFCTDDVILFATIIR
jgi:hypothetical protein